MKKILALLISGFLLVSITARADEGMWLLPLLEQLNIRKMNQMGCKLSADEIYSINHASLKDAIIIFGGGCTGEIVSDQGLIFTNHHCGFDAIQYHSTLEHDYLSNGFWAKNFSEELYTPDLKATFLIRIEDVTSRVMSVLKDNMKEDARQAAIEDIKNKIKSEATAGTHYEASVDDFFGGNNFYLLVYEVYNDIRLVGTPPNSIGKFGYDTDNWMWPRHTGDFSIFRIYGDKDGHPAPYSKDNVPLKPKKYLPITLKGVEKDDFTMVMGYPGSTERYISSYEVKEMMEVTNPNRIKIRGTRQDIISKDMLADPKIRIQYAAKYSESSNYWKYSIGQNQGLGRLDVFSRKQQEEKEFQDWVNADAERKSQYGDALTVLQTAITARRPITHANQYLMECFFQGTELFSEGIKFYRLLNTLNFTPDSTREIKDLVEKIRKSSDDFFKDYSLSTDKKVAVAMLKLYAENVPADYYPEFLKKAKVKYKGDYAKYVEYLYKKSFLVDKVRTEEFLKNPTNTALLKDPGIAATMDLISVYFTLNGASEQIDNLINPAMRKYIGGTIEKNKEKTYYPDANFTMRLTYGKVGDYKARDGVYYDYYTTLAGVMEKEDSANFEFNVHPRLKELYQSKDFGPYAKNGQMRVCFTTNNDITGGNSGSPVLNGNGELIGLAFDGNWEAMSGDVVYEPDIQKCICVDIRYVLFVIDKFAGAHRLIDELNIKP